MARTLVALLAVLAAACSSLNPFPDAYGKAGKYPLIRASHDAAEKLAGRVGDRLAPGPVLVATLVDINDLGSSSAFGRTVSEQLSAGLTRAGMSVMEMKYRGSVYVRKSQGELVLSRDIANLADKHEAQAVVAGSYAVGSDLVFVNLKVIRHKDNAVLASQDYALPLDDNIRALLAR